MGEEESNTKVAKKKPKKVYDTINELCDDRDPWERQPFETDKQWFAFKAYLHLMEATKDVVDHDGNVTKVPLIDKGRGRTLRAAYEQFNDCKMGSSFRTKYPWCNNSKNGFGWPKRNSWMERTEAYDRFRHEQEITADIAGAVESRKFRKRALQAGIASALRGLQGRNMADENFGDVVRALDRLTGRLAEEYNDIPIQKTINHNINSTGTVEEVRNLVKRADELSDAEVVQRYRQMRKDKEGNS